MKKCVIAMALGTLLIAGGVQAEDDTSTTTAAVDQGHGTIKFKGSIIDAPCSISPESADQTVELGQIASVALQNGGKSSPEDFGIQLESCDVTALAEKKATATFTGTEGAIDGSLAIAGTASGASIILNNGQGGTGQVKLGEETTKQTIATGSNTLWFSAFLQGNNADTTDPVTPGEFTSVVQFNMAYY